MAPTDKDSEPGLLLVEIGVDLGNKPSFEACLKSGRYKTLVQQGVQAGSQAGVNATPTFLVNGEFLSGVPSEADLSRIIDRQLSSLADNGLSVQASHSMP